MNQPCRKILTTLLIGLCLSGAAVRADDAMTVSSFTYDAKVAWLDAGELLLHMNRSRESYEFAGMFATSREMSTYYKWNGSFAGAGRWSDAGPQGEAYLAKSVSKDKDLKIVVMSGQSVRVLEKSGGEFETVERPEGNDLISAIFLTPSCYRGGFVHDGEDQYEIALREEQTREMHSGDRYYVGSVTDCKYEVTDKKGRKRRLVVSMGDVNGSRVAVQVRAKIPLWPDPIFRLKMPPVMSTGAVAVVE